MCGREQAAAAAVNISNDITVSLQTCQSVTLADTQTLTIYYQQRFHSSNVADTTNQSSVNVNPLTPTVAIKHFVPDRVKLPLVIFDIRAL